jgi:hypothetical protein
MYSFLIETAIAAASGVAKITPNAPASTPKNICENKINAGSSETALL